MTTRVEGPRRTGAAPACIRVVERLGPLCFAALLASGCGTSSSGGGANEGSPGGTGAGGGSSAIASGSGGIGGSSLSDLSGAYDLVFETETSPGGTPPQSVGRSVRVYVGTDAGEYIAEVPQSDLPDSPQAPGVRSDAIALTVPVMIGYAVDGDHSFEFTGDMWNELRLARSSDGFIGSFEAIGGYGDSSEPLPISATGTLTPDSAPPQPEIHSEGGDRAPGLHLPWETIAVTFGEHDEAVDRDQLAASIAFTRTPAGGQAEPLAETVDLWPGQGARGGWAGARAARVAGLPWDDLAGATVGFELAPGLTDYAGNVGAAKAGSMTFAAVPPHAAFTFESGTGDLASWGSVAPIGAPACEDAGCLLIGPSFCSDGGLAGRLVATGSSKMVVRYRLVSAAETIPSFSGPLAARVLVPASTQVSGDPGDPSVASSPMVDLGAAAGELHWATDWHTLEVPLSASDEAAFELRASPCGEIAPIPLLGPVGYVIDSVLVQ